MKAPYHIPPTQYYYGYDISPRREFLSQNRAYLYAGDIDEWRNPDFSISCIYL